MKIVLPCRFAAARVSILLLVSFIFAASTAVAQEFVYVANRASNTVFAYRANVFTGQLTPVPGSPFAAGEEPINLVVDRAGRFLYVENRGSQTVSGYTINPFTGSLTAVPGSPIGFPGGAPRSDVLGGLAIDPFGRFLYVAHNNGVTAYSIDFFTGVLRVVPGSPFPGPTSLESAVVDPTGRFLYAGDSISNLTGYRIDPATGALTPIYASPLPGGVGAAAVAAHPNGRFLYALNLWTGIGRPGGIWPYSIDPSSGLLTPNAFPTINLTLPLITGLTVDPIGRFLYTFQSFSVYQFWIDSIFSGQPFLSSFVIPPVTTTVFGAGQVDSTGRFLYLLGTQGIFPYTIDGFTGALSPIPGAAVGPGGISIAVTPISWLAFLVP